MAKLYLTILPHIDETMYSSIADKYVANKHSRLFIKLRVPFEKYWYISNSLRETKW